MKFGVFSVSMPEYDVTETVRLLTELGYDGVEWRVQTMPAQKPENIPFAQRYWAYNRSTLDIATLADSIEGVRALCDQNHLDIIGLTTYLHPDQPAEVEKVLQCARRIGCRQVRVFPPSYDGKEGYAALFNRTELQVRKLETLARRYEVKIVLEIHMDTLIASPSAAYRLICRCDPRYIGLIFDPGNMVNEGFENYQKSFELLGNYIAHVHVKNARLVEDGMDKLGAVKWKREWVPLKKGMADLGKLFAVMRDKGYDGTVCIEDFSNEENTADKLRHNLEYLRQLRAGTGF